MHYSRTAILKKIKSKIDGKAIYFDRLHVHYLLILVEYYRGGVIVRALSRVRVAGRGHVAGAEGSAVGFLGTGGDGGQAVLGGTAEMEATGGR